MSVTSPRPRRVGRTGARFARAPEPPAPPADGPDPQADPDTGAAPGDEVQRLREQVADLRRRLAAADAHAEATDRENHRLRSAAPGDTGFGMRAEKLLRLAESEATDVRVRAARDAAELGERARAEAEAHRHEVEQALIARSAELERGLAEQRAALDEREARIAEQLETARAEADRLGTAALRDADRVRRLAEEQAAEELARARAEASRLREDAAADVARLRTLQEEARAVLARLAATVSAELATPRPGTSPPATSPPATSPPATSRPARRAAR